MSRVAEIAHNLIRIPIIVPLLLAFVVANSDTRGLVTADAKRWSDVFKWRRQPTVWLLCRLFRGATREFRNLYYYRLTKGTLMTKLLSRALAFLIPGERTLFIRSRSIGPGLFIQHGFSTIITATSIGKDCWVNQQVTIGHAGKKGSPTIGNNVRIAAGAIVIGPVLLGDDVIVGAGAVVTKDVPSGAVAIGPQATWTGKA